MEKKMKRLKMKAKEKENKYYVKIIFYFLYYKYLNKINI